MRTTTGMTCTDCSIRTRPVHESGSKMETHPVGGTPTFSSHQLLHPRGFLRSVSFKSSWYRVAVYPTEVRDHGGSLTNDKKSDSRNISRESVGREFVPCNLGKSNIPTLVSISGIGWQDSNWRGAGGGVQTRHSDSEELHRTEYHCWIRRGDGYGRRRSLQGEV